VALGSAVAEATAPVTSGFTRAYAGRVLLQDGRQCFLKATGPELPIPLAALGREAQVLEALGDQIPAVPMIGAAASSDGGRVLALEWVEGHLPGFPWTEEQIALVREACERVADVPASALDGLAPGRLADDLLADDQLQAALADGPVMPGPWCISRPGCRRGSTRFWNWHGRLRHCCSATTSTISTCDPTTCSSGEGRAR
jgi:hypothetical protein